MLFESKNPISIPLKDADVFYNPSFYNSKEADEIFKILKTQTK